MAGKGRPGHAFISCAPEDTVAADRLQGALEAAGIRVWRDSSVLPGQDWRIEIRRAITEGAMAFVACFSSRSLARGKGRQYEELVLAVEQMRVRLPGAPWLMPVRFDECLIPDLDIGAGRTMRSIRPADLFGESAAAETERLITSILHVLGAAPSPAVPAGSDAGPDPDHGPAGEPASLPIAAARRITIWQQVMSWNVAIRAALISGVFVVIAGLIPYLLGAYSGNPHSVPQSHGSAAIIARVYSAASYGFKAPNRIAADGTHVWVTNPPGNSVTELNASDGGWVATLAAASYGFNGPVGIAYDGTHVWVANTNGNSVTELNASDGSWVATLARASYGFSRPYAIAVDGAHVWVANNYGNSVTELNASDGSLVRILAGGRYSFSYPAGIAVDGTHVWVANSGGNSVTELNASDGSWVATLTGASYGFFGPRSIVLDSTHVWVANAGGDSVTELNASDGSWVATLTGASYGFQGPWGMAAEGAHVWVANSGGDSVTELTAG